MENASKALIMAGGVLIAMLILTVFVYMYGKMKEGSSEIYSALQETEITKFNQQFLNYEGRGLNKDTLTGDLNYMSIQDVVTLVNMAKNNNDGNSKFSMYVDVYVNDIKWTDKDKEFLLTALMERAEKKYTCGYNKGNSNGPGVYINPKTQLVEKVYIYEV